MEEVSKQQNADLLPGRQRDAWGPSAGQDGPQGTNGRLPSQGVKPGSQQSPSPHCLGTPLSVALAGQTLIPSGEERNTATLFCDLSHIMSITVKT